MGNDGELWGIRGNILHGLLLIPAELLFIPDGLLLIPGGLLLIPCG